MSNTKQKSPLDKAAHTWLVKNYTYKLTHPDSEHSSNKASIFVKFITRNALKNDRLEAAATALYYKNKNTIETKLQRIRRSEKLKKLTQKYPKLNIEKGFKVAMLHGNFSLTHKDIKLFENVLLAVLRKPKAVE